MSNGIAPIGVIQIDELSVSEAKTEYQWLMQTFQWYLNLSDEEAALAVSIATGVCPYCWADKRGCQCWNDE